MATTPSPHPSSSLTTHLAFCTRPDSSRQSSVRIVEPSAREAHYNRGNLYVLLELMGESPARNRILRQLLNDLQQTYYTAKGSQSMVLTATLQSAHRSLQQANLENPETELRAGLTCATLLRDQLVLACSGPALNLLANPHEVQQLSPDPSDFGPPLGGVAEPTIDFYRHQVADGDVIFMGESDWSARLSMRLLAGAIAHADPENRYEVVQYLRAESGDADTLGLLIVLEAEPVVWEGPDAEPEPGELPRRTVGPAATGRGGRSRLPTSVGASPPLQDLPDTRPIPLGPGSGRSKTQPSRTPSVEPTAAPGAWVQISAGAAAAARTGVRWLSTLVGRMLPDRSPRRRSRAAEGASLAPPPVRPHPPPAAPASPVQAKQEPGPAPGRSPSATASAVTGAIADAVAEFQPPRAARGSRARLFILVAVLILVLVPITVSAIYLQGAANRTDAEELVNLAATKLEQARQMIDSGDKTSARTLLSDAQLYLEQGAQIIGHTARISELSAQVYREMQTVMQVVTLYGLDVPLWQFVNASAQEVVVADQDVYLLDTGRQLVQYLRLDASREVVVEETGPVLAQGDTVGGVTVGRLVDITWQPRITGFADKPSLLILDRNNNVFRYNRVEGPTLLRFAGQSSWQTPSRLEVYNGRLYLADEGANQILRYSPAGSGYDETPVPWFAPQTVANLAGLRTMKIDGDIWLLYENGQILRYNQGEQTPFALESNVGLAKEAVDMVIGESDIYLADAADERVLVYSKNGSYKHQFKAAEGHPMRGLRSVRVDEGTGKIFVLTMNTLYQQSLPR